MNWPASLRACMQDIWHASQVQHRRLSVRALHVSHRCKPSSGMATSYMGATARSRRQLSTLKAFLSKHEHHTTGPSAGLYVAAAAISVSVVLGLVYTRPPLFTEASTQPKPRYIRLPELKKHGQDCPDGVWVSRGVSFGLAMLLECTNVYDISDWVQGHPGGSVILRAAGGALEPYWSVFSFHQRPDIMDMLEEMKIGEVDPRDLVNGRVPADAIEDPFKDDPTRDPRLIQLTQKPCNAETPKESLSTWLTPTETFFTRNHLWVPRSTGADWQLEIELPDGETKVYTLGELKKRFRQHTISATLQCSGNRRSHMSAASRPTNGLQWNAGAISNAEWTGVKLCDILKDAGLDDQNIPEHAKHAQFFGAEGYGASIPIHKACDPQGDVLLAFAMNGQDLPPDHGAPVRALVPGHVAARSVKWISRISIAPEESTSQWQRRDYKCFGPNVGSNPNWDNAKAIQELPVQSAITNIQEYSLHSDEERAMLRNYGLEEDFVKISGYAFSGGGREIQRVDISVDGGNTWRQATLESNPSRGSKTWSWTQWNTMVPRTFVGREIVVKAVDEAYNTQPESFDATWNHRGNLASCWHRVPRPAFKN